MALEIAKVEECLKEDKNNKILFNALMLKFLEEYVPPVFGHLTESSARKYESCCRKLSVFFKGKYADEINSGMVMELISSMATEGSANKTIAGYVGVISSIFSFGGEQGCIERNFNPARDLSRNVKKRLKQFKQQRRYFSHEEEEAILKALYTTINSRNNELVAKESGLSDIREQMYILDVETGLRESELCNLRVRNLELHNKNKFTGYPEPQIRLIGKGRKERIVPLTKRALDSLPSKCWSKLTDPNEWVFINPLTTKDGAAGKPFTKLIRGLKLTAKRAGIADWERLKFHDFRRTFGVRYLKKHRKDYWTLKEILGHSSIAVTEKSYAWLETEDLHANFQDRQSGGQSGGESFDSNN